MCFSAMLAVHTRVVGSCLQLLILQVQNIDVTNGSAHGRLEHDQCRSQALPFHA